MATVPLSEVVDRLTALHNKFTGDERETWIRWNGRPPTSKGQYLVVAADKCYTAMFDTSADCWVSTVGRFAIGHVQYYRDLPPWPTVPPMDLAKLPKVSAHRARMDQSGQKRK